MNELKTNRLNNIDKYSSNTSFVSNIVENYELQLYNLEKEVEYPVLDKTIATKENGLVQWKIDFENSKKLYLDFVKKYDIPLGVLSDERFIAYLTHDIYYDYMSTRWPIDGGKESRLAQKYFLPSGAQSFTRNFFLRLFWYAYVTYDENLEDPFFLTEVAFEYADPVNQIMERKYGRNSKIVKCALMAIKKVGSKTLNQKRTIYGKKINNILSLYALDLVTENELIELFENEIRGIIKSDVEDSSPIEEE